jgi:hypothetical protein
MPKASEAGDKPVKKVKTESKAKPEKTDKVKSASAEKAVKTVKASVKAADTPVVAKAAAKVPTKRASAPRQTASDAKKGNVPALSDEQRRYYVEVAAYYIAERRGFSGSQLEDWVQAEAEIDQLLREGILKP